MKQLDIDYQRTKENDCDIAEILLCIQAWHEMLNPGHHYVKLYSDGSGYVVAAPNYPPMYGIPMNERKPLMTFVNLKDFIKQTRKALKENKIEVIDTRRKKTKR